MPVPISRLQVLMQSGMGSHALRVKQCVSARAATPWHLRRGSLRGTSAPGDESHFAFSLSLCCPSMLLVLFTVPGQGCYRYHAMVGDTRTTLMSAID